MKPWLADAYKWTTTRHARRRHPARRELVRRAAFSASDVAYTFNLCSRNPAFDKNGVWLGLKSVQAQGGDTVVFTFKEPSRRDLQQDLRGPDRPGAHLVQGPRPGEVHQPERRRHRPVHLQVLQRPAALLARNPKYWQADKVKVQQLTFTNNGGGGDADKLRLANGQYDWNGMFISDIQKTYVNRTRSTTSTGSRRAPTSAST